MRPDVAGSARMAAPIDLRHAFIRRTDLSFANLEGANLSGADCTNVNFHGANFKEAILDKTVLKGADLSAVRNLTKKQLAQAIVDDKTLLPDYLR